MSPHSPEDPARLEQRLTELEHRLSALTARLESLEHQQNPQTEEAPLSPTPPQARMSTPVAEPSLEVPPPLPPRDTKDERDVRQTSDETKNAPAPTPTPITKPTTASTPTFDHKTAPSPKPALISASIPSPAPALGVANSVPAAPSPEESDWRDLLRRLRILPPEHREGENLELEIGRWWFARFGILFAVAGTVFFAIYISQYTSPLQRLTSLCAVSLGVVGLGWWLERRMPQFGAVVFAGGLALLYFASWASHGVEAVQVFTEPWPSLVWQFATVAGIVLCAAWRQRPTVATMATLLGFWTCFLTTMDDRSTTALGAAAMLGAASVRFQMWRGWLRPLLVAIPLTYALFAYAVFRHPEPEPWLSAPAGWAWLMGFMLLYGAADALALWRGRDIPGTPRKGLFIFNSSAAVFLGYVFTSLHYRGQLDIFYFLFGGVLLAATLAYYFTHHRDALMHAWFIKATGLLTLGLIEVCDARTRWIALLVESALLLWSAARSRLKITEVASGVVWVASLGFFGWFIVENYFDAAGVLKSRDALLGLAWVAGSAAVLGVWARVMPPWALIEVQGERTRESVQALAGVALAAGAVLWAWGFLPRELWWPAATGVLALGLALIAVGSRQWAGLIAAGLVFAAANLRFWFYAPESELIGWGNAAVLVALGLGSTLVHGLWARRRPKWNSRQSALWIDTLLNFCWMMSLHVAAYRAWPVEIYLFAMTALSLTVAGLSRLAPLRRMTMLVALPLGLALLGLIWMIAEGHPPNPAAVQKMWLWGVIAGVWIFTVGQKMLSGSNIGDAMIEVEPDYGAALHQLSSGAHALHASLAAMLTIVSLFIIFDMPELIAVMGVAMLAIAALGRAVRLRAAFAAAVVYFIIAHWLAQPQISFINTPGAQARATLISVVAMEMMAIVFISIAVWWLSGSIWRGGGCKEQGIDDMRTSPLTDDVTAALQWIGGLAILVTLFRLFYAMPGVWQHYISVSWGVAAIVVLGAGFAGQARPLRLLGIAALALTSVRVCLVDIQSMIYRIAAFIALGIVMLLVAFLYHRFSAMIRPKDR